MSKQSWSDFADSMKGCLQKHTEGSTGVISTFKQKDKNIKISQKYLWDLY